MAGAGTGTGGGSSSSGGSEATTSPPSSQGKTGGGTPFEYFGWVYHMGVNSVGHDYCHLRFLYLKGKHVHMYMRDPHEDPSAGFAFRCISTNTHKLLSVIRFLLLSPSCFAPPLVGFRCHLDPGLRVNSHSLRVVCFSFSRTSELIWRAFRFRYVNLLVGVAKNTLPCFLHLKAIRKGVVSNALMVEDLGRKKVNHGDGDVYVLRIYSRLDETKKGEIACATPGEAQKWMEAFDQAKQQADFELSQGSSQTRLNIENEFNLEGHRSRMRPYAADGLKKLIRIGKGPEKLLRRSYYLRNKVSSVDRFEGDGPDAIEAHEWKCVRTVNGLIAISA
ncbi:hypothetical protein ACLOJK_027456 [Asimina triloba]